MAEKESAPAFEVRTAEEGPVARTLEVQVGARRVKRAYDRAYRDLAKSVSVRGFRPGKAPRSVLEKLYGASVTEQVQHALVAETLPRAVEQEGLEPVAEPSIEMHPSGSDADFRYRARIEIKPAVELPDLQGLAARRLPVEVPEADVDREHEALRVHHAPEVEEPEDTPVAAEHILSLDFVGRIDGEPFEGGSGRDVRVEVGAGRFIPGFEEQLLGATAGEDRQVRVTFPEDYGAKEVAGREAVFDVHVGAVKRRALPVLDDEFAKDLGDFASLDALRQRVRDDLAAARERASRAELRRTLMDSLIERAPFDVPPGMVERELARQLRGARHRLEGAVEEAAMSAQLERWREEWRPRAEREVREVLLLEAVARAQGLGAEPEEVEERIGEMARREGMKPEALRKAYGDEALREGLRSQLVEDKALEFLASQAKVEETADS